MFNNRPQLRSTASALLAIWSLLAPYESSKVYASTRAVPDSNWATQRMLSRAAWSNGDYDACAQHLRQALSLSESDRSNPVVSARNSCQSLLDLARVYLTQHKVMQTIQTCDRCLDLAAANDLSASSLCVNALVVRAMANGDAHNKQAALSDLESARDLAQKCGASARDLLEDIEISLGRELAAHWRFTEARQAFMRALSLIETSAPAHRQLMLPSIYLSLCQVDVSMGSWDEGTKHGLQAIDGYLRRDPHANGSLIICARVYTAYCCLHRGDRAQGQKLLAPAFASLSSTRTISLLKQDRSALPIGNCLLSAAPLCDAAVGDQCRRSAQRLR